MRTMCRKLTSTLAIATCCFIWPTHNARAASMDDTYIPGLQAMTEQLTLTMLHQAQLIGMMIDAQTQLDTQRTLQKMMARANKDYLPSEALCTFGTGTRSLAKSDYDAGLKKVKVASFMADRQTMKSGTAAGAAIGDDYKNRFISFRDKFCNPGDLDGNLGQNGKHNICNTAGRPATPGSEDDVINKDINFTRAIDAAPSFSLDFTNQSLDLGESAIFALGSNLYNSDTSPFTGIDGSVLEKRDQTVYQKFLKTRQLAALRSVAQNSYATQVALKGRTNNPEVKPFMEAAFKGMGVLNANDLQNFLGGTGKGPSYDTQMNYLTKTIYQNPSFYTNLIDKPANIDRQRASMSAFGLMQKRDIADVFYRREMLLSALIEARLRNTPAVTRPVVDGGATVRGVMGN